MLLAPAVVRAEDLREQSSRSWDAAGSRAIEVSNPRGLTSIRASRDGRIHLVALKIVHLGGTAQGRDLARNTRVEAGPSGERFAVRVVYPQRRVVRIGLWDLVHGLEIPQVEVRLSLEVPPSIPVELHTASGDLETAGLTSRQSLRTVSGDVEVSDADGALSVVTASGDLRLDEVAATRIQTTSGDVEIGFSRGPLTVTTASGDVTLDASDDSVTVTTTSGEVRIGHGRRGVRVHSESGDVSATASGRVDVETTSGEARIELALPVLAADIRTQSGDVSVRVPSRLECRIDAQTSSGDLDVSLPLETQTTGQHRLIGTIGRGTVPLRLRSSSGNLELRP
jgi:hypothetical protein